MKSATHPLTPRVGTPGPTPAPAEPRVARRGALEAGWTTRWTSSPLMRGASPLTVGDRWPAEAGRRTPAPVPADD